MVNNVIGDAEKKMKEIIQVLEEALKRIHTGRANTGLVENILVPYYGQQMAIKAMANLAIPEASQIVITPWDAGQLNAIEVAIREAQLGLNPGNDGRSIRISLPPLTAERREQLIKQVKATGEEARIELRNVRHDALERAKRDFEAGLATEDDKFAAIKRFDESITKHNQQVGDLIQAKEEELLKV